MHDSTQAPTIGAKQLLMRIVFSLPLIGWALKDLHLGKDSAMTYFGANILMLWLFAGLMWGITGALAGAYILLPLYGIALLTIMRM